LNIFVAVNRRQLLLSDEGDDERDAAEYLHKRNPIPLQFLIKKRCITNSHS